MFIIPSSFSPVAVIPSNFWEKAQLPTSLPTSLPSNSQTNSRPLLRCISPPRGERCNFHLAPTKVETRSNQIYETC